MKRLFFAASFAALLFSANPSQHAGAAMLAPQRIAHSAESVAEATDSVGRCFHAVKEALKPLGVVLTGTSAYMAKSQLMEDDRFKVVVSKHRMQSTDVGKLQQGDILVHGKSGAHPYGHIAIYLGDNKEASDHVQKLVLGNTYSSTTVFRLKNAPGPIVAMNLPQPLIASKARKSNSAIAFAAYAAKPKASWSYVNIAQNGTAEALNHALHVAKPKRQALTISSVAPLSLLGFVQQ